MSSYADLPVSGGVALQLTLDPKAVDTFVNDICGGESEIITDLVQIYLQSLDDLVGQMVSAWQTEDYVLLRRAAHSLKSSSRIFGANLLADNCECLEKSAVTGELANVPFLIEQIQQQSQRMRQLLVTEFTGIDGEA